VNFRLVIPPKSFEFIKENGNEIQKVNIDALLRHLKAAEKHAEFLQATLKDIYIKGIKR